MHGHLYFRSCSRKGGPQVQCFRWLTMLKDLWEILRKAARCATTSGTADVYGYLCATVFAVAIALVCEVRNSVFLDANGAARPQVCCTCRVKCDSHVSASGQVVNMSMCRLSKTVLGESKFGWTLSVRPCG